MQNCTPYLQRQALSAGTAGTRSLQRPHRPPSSEAGRAAPIQTCSRPPSPLHLHQIQTRLLPLPSPRNSGQLAVSGVLMKDDFRHPHSDFAKNFNDLI